MSTFIIDCPSCKAKVAAAQEGVATRSSFDEEAGEPYGVALYLGSCPHCSSLLVGQATQTGFKGYDSEEDTWSDVVRVHPSPPKAFASARIPRVVLDSLREADRSLQANANIAACVMLGRALEAVTRDILERKSEKDPPGKQEEKSRPIGLARGIRALHDKHVIDSRLYEWSQQLHAFRNLAAHAEDVVISRVDAEDLQSFVYAIVEYVYDLTERYEEFKARMERRSKRSGRT